MAFQSSLEGGALPPNHLPNADAPCRPARACRTLSGSHWQVEMPLPSGAVTRPAELMDSSWPNASIPIDCNRAPQSR